MEDFVFAEAFTRRYRYLTRTVIPAGLIDLKRELPSRNVEVIATTASLVVRAEMHRGVTATWELGDANRRARAVVEPSLEGVGLLAVMIVIRTGLGWTTVLEINGRWLWQRTDAPA